MLFDHGPAGLAELVTHDDSMPSTPPSPATSRTSQTPLPTCEEMQFHDSPRALVERILLHGRAATNAIAEAAFNGDPRAWKLATIGEGFAGRKFTSRFSRHYKMAAKEKFGDTSAAMLERHDENDADGAVAGGPSSAIDPMTGGGAVSEGDCEVEDTSLTKKEAIEDVGHQKLGYDAESGTGTGNRKTTLDHAANKGEEAVTGGKTVTERAAPQDNSTQNDTRRGKSAQDRPTATDILQAAKGPFIAGLLKLNEQTLGLREKRAAQKDATKEAPVKCKEQDAMAAMYKALQQNLGALPDCMNQREENEGLFDLERNASARTSQEIQGHCSEQKQKMVASIRKLSRKHNLSREEQTALLGDEKVRVLFNLAARCRQALETFGTDSDGEEKEAETEKEKGNETIEEQQQQTVEKRDASEEQSLKDEILNGVKATEKVPVAVTR